MSVWMCIKNYLNVGARRTCTRKWESVWSEPLRQQTWQTMPPNKWVNEWTKLLNILLLHVCHLWNCSDNRTMISWYNGRQRRTGPRGGESEKKWHRTEKHKQYGKLETVNAHKIMYSITKSFHRRAAIVGIAVATHIHTHSQCVEKRKWYQKHLV